MTNTKAQVGDLIRIVNATTAKFKYNNGGIFEVKSRGRSCNHGVWTTCRSAGFIYDKEYVIHRKAGEEDSPKCTRDLFREAQLQIVEGKTPEEAVAISRAEVKAEQEAVNSPQHYTDKAEEIRGQGVPTTQAVHIRKAGEEDSEKPCEKCASFAGTDNEGSFCSRECIERMQRKHVPAQSDAVNSPQHYTQGRIEVIDIIEDAVQGATPFEAVCQANILKYTLRYRAKNGVEDLNKAKWYMERLIKHLDEMF